MKTPTRNAPQILHMSAFEHNNPNTTRHTVRTLTSGTATASTEVPADKVLLWLASDGTYVSGPTRP